MKFKQGVPDDKNIDPRLYLAREIYDELLMFYFAQGEGTITSTKDGKHMSNSKHYSVPRQGEDWRFPILFRNMLFDLQTKLADIGMELIIEKDHFHIESR